MEGVARAADRGQSREDLAARRQVFDTADAERGRRAVGGRSVGGADEELAGRDDREITADVIHRVILGAQAGGLKDAGIGTCRLRRGVATRDDQRAAQHCGGVGADETGEADTVEVRPIGGREELSIRVGEDIEGRLGDGRRQAARLDQGVIGSPRAGQAVTGHGDRLVRGGVGIAEDRQGGTGDDRGIPGAADRRDHGRSREGCAHRGIIDAIHRCHAHDRHGERGDAGRGGLAGREDIISREAGAIGQLDRAGGHLVRAGDILGVESGGEGPSQRLGADEAHERQRSGGRGRAIIDLIVRGQRRRDRLRRDREGARNVAERIISSGLAAGRQHIAARMAGALARAGIGGGAGEDRVRVTVEEPGIAHAGAAREGVAVVGLGRGRDVHRQGGGRHGERGRVADGLGEDVIGADEAEAGAREAIGAHVTGQRGVGRESQRAGDGGRQGVAIAETGDRTREGRFSGAVGACGGLRDEGQGRGRDRHAAVDELREGVIGRVEGTRGRGVGVGAHRAAGQGGGDAAGGAGDAGGDEVLAVHETGEGRGEGRIGRAVFARRVGADERQGGLIHGQRAGGETDDVIIGGQTARREGVGTGVDRALAGAGEADGAREHGRGLVVTEARIGQRGPADEGLAVVRLGRIARGDGQGRRGDGQRRGVRDVLGENIVARGGGEAGDIDTILPHPARGGGVRGEDEGAGGGGGEGLAILEAGHGRGEGRVGRAVFTRSRGSRQGQRRRGDGEATVHSTGEDVVVRGISAGVRDQRIGADRTGRRGRGGHATDARDAGGRQGFAVHEARERGGEGRIGITVETRRVLGDHGQRRLVDGQRARDVGEDVVAAGETRKSEGIGARVDRALGRAAVSQRAAEVGGVFAVLEAGEDRAEAAREGEAVVDLARGERGHGEGLRVDDAVGGGVQRVDEVVRRFGAREREAAERIVLARTGAREHEFARAAGGDGVTGQNAAEHEVGGRQQPGAVIGLARRGGELPGRDRLVADEDRRAREITAGLAEARSRQGIVPHGQGSARRERAGSAEREGHAATEAIIVSIGRTARAADGERGQGITSGGQILDAADRVGRCRAVGRGGVGHLNEELARRDDGIIAGDVIHRVVGRGQARRHEDARVGAGRTGRRVAAGDGQRAAEPGGDVVLTGHETGEVRAVEADRIVQADETSIGIGRDGQHGRRDRRRDGRHRGE